MKPSSSGHAVGAVDEGRAPAPGITPAFRAPSFRARFRHGASAAADRGRSGNSLSRNAPASSKSARAPHRPGRGRDREALGDRWRFPALRLDERSPSPSRGGGRRCSAPATATSRPPSRLSRSGTAETRVRWKEPSLLRTTPGRPARPQGRKSAKRAAVRRYSRGSSWFAPGAERWPGCAGARRPTSTKSGSRFAAPDRREPWPMAPDGKPDQPEAQAEPDAPASVPFMMAMVRGAPPSRIGSVSARWTGTAEAWHPMLRPPAIRQRPPPKEEEGQEEARGREMRSRGRRRSGSAGGSRRCRRSQRQAGDDDDDHRDDLGDRPFDGPEDGCSGAPTAWTEPDGMG